MPNRWAVATGNWSSTATWNSGGTLGLPTASDDVFISGSFTVTIDQDINVLSLNTTASGSGAGAIAGGGSFSVASSRSISTNRIVAGTGNCLVISGTGITVNVTGSVTGSNTAGSVVGINITANNSTVNISGSGILGGGNSSFSNTHGVNISSTSTTLNISGSVSSATGGNGGCGIFIGSTTSTINVNGNIVANAGFNTLSISYGGTSNTLRVVGNAFGGGTSNNTGLTVGGIQNNFIFVGDMFGSTNLPAVTIGATSPFTASIIGNSFNTLGGSGLSITSTGLGTVTMTGSINGGLGTNWFGASFTATNLTFNLLGNINAGGAGGTNAQGLNYSSGGTNTTLNIVGSVNGTVGGSGLTTSVPVTINVTGSVTGGSGILVGISNGSTGIVNISGSAIGGLTSTAYGVTNSSTGTVRVTTAVASLFAAGINNTLATGTGSFESAVYASNGTQPWSGFCRLRSSANNFITTATDTGGTKTLVDSNNALFGLPAASDVRLGTTYNFGANTGTCAIPSASQVAAGIAVDNTVGTAVLTAGSVASAVWGTQTTAITESGSIGDRLKNSATVSSTGDQITALIV